MLAVLAAIGVPQGFLEFVTSLYRINRAVRAWDGTVLFHFLAGILQGCPLSGLLFTLVANPFFLHICSLIDAASKGISRICADDLCTLLWDRNWLALLVAPFRLA